ncbi:hypothetical protein FK531_14790 [Rhodococcus spelaei]|uniref:Uncharacterized protein n=1 Tax=Rhodococcus spelaei TaxID=2546320 RepID=A0A541B7P7_9NOCA|nr:hypothetical protein [Rhodococcus spelaei]TQF68351.1 hypothetical protein FK531_14790 [Rhodococcus spelaei]
MSGIRKTNWDRRCVTTTTAELRTRGLAAIVADEQSCREVLVTEPGRGWMASVLPGDTPDDELDVLLFAAEPAQQWTEGYLRWADSVESLLAVRPAAA